MMDENGEITRQFTADVTDVLVEPELMRARFLAIVVSDIKTESDDSDHGHTDGGHTDGGHTEAVTMMAATMREITRKVTTEIAEPPKGINRAWVRFWQLR